MDRFIPERINDFDRHGSGRSDEDRRCEDFCLVLCLNERSRLSLGFRHPDCPCLPPLRPSIPSRGIGLIVQQLAYFQLRDLPLESHCTVVARRWARVSSRFASVTHSTYSFLWL